MTESCEFDVVDVENFDEGTYSPNGSPPHQAALFQAALAQAQMKQIQTAPNPIPSITPQHEKSNPNQISPIRAGSKRTPAEREEMVMRKKLRNRESAQRARDRQKAKMRWLEEELQRIKIKNEQLLRENLILRHMVQGTGPNPTQNPQMNQNQSQIQQLNQQVNQIQQTQPTPAQQTLQNMRTLPKTGTNQQIFQQAKSKDSEGSMPSIISTGSQNVISPQINQNGDDLLKAAAAAPRNTTQQQQYAAALAAIAQQNPIQANLALLQNPNQLAAAMAQATVVAAQQSIAAPVENTVPTQNSPNKTRPSSVGPGSGCHTSDAISE